jgi:NAD(P)-dependent dehydrogenase (short-subunit alcohol dehydrogenase family)
VGIKFDCSFDFGGRTAIVTGGSSGIGFAVVSALLDSGASVAVFARDEEKLAKLPQGALPVRCDVGDAVETEKAVSIVVSRFGVPHFLVNSVGLNIRKAIFDLSEEELTDMFRTNFFGTFRLCRMVARLMATQWKSGEPYCKIVNIASTGAWQGSLNYGGYNSSKAALVNATRIMANEWCPKGIIVNAVCPGPTLTPFLPYWKDAARVQAVANKTPAGRVADPEDIVGPVLFFLSSASNWIVGQPLAADGGKSLNG